MRGLSPQQGCGSSAIIRMKPLWQMAGFHHRDLPPLHHSPKRDRSHPQSPFLPFVRHLIESLENARNLTGLIDYVHLIDIRGISSAVPALQPRLQVSPLS